MSPPKALAAEFGLAEAVSEALDRYVDLLHGWDRGNLTGLRRRSEIVEVLVADSLGLLDVPHVHECGGAGWLDLGAGAGIPGIPLAIAVPGARIVLLDSSEKKCAFLRAAVEVAGLGARARVVRARSEHYAAPGAEGREATGLVLARAVAPLAVLLELAAPLLETGGVLLASKTRKALEQEGADAEQTAGLCGLAAEASVPLPRSSLTDSVCAVYRKVAATPARLPRREGMAAKRPLTR